jgi:hypothetical protein
VAECLPSKHAILGSILGTAGRKTRKRLLIDWWKAGADLGGLRTQTWED